MFLKLNSSFSFPVLISSQIKPSEQFMVPFPGPSILLILCCIVCVCVCVYDVSACGMVSFAWVFVWFAPCFHLKTDISLPSFSLPSLTKDVSIQVNFHTDTHVGWGLHGLSVCACFRYLVLFPKF